MPTRPATSRSCTTARPSAGSPPAATHTPTMSLWRWATFARRSRRRPTALRSRSSARRGAHAGSSGRSSIRTACACALDRRCPGVASYGTPRERQEDGMGKKGLLERLNDGPVICAEGYLFELERRGYLQAGAYVPEVVLDFPEQVENLHRDFLRAGSDVIEAFTYYAHREKLRLIGRESELEPMNRQALAIAKKVAAEGDALVAGNICNTNIYEPNNAASAKQVRAMFEEQVGWAVDAGVDLIVAETISWL